MVTIALIGNPNVGKTVIFNNLTGSWQHVGNWPGVTVEKKEGKCKYNGSVMNIVDLPGTYSLTANAIDELIARNYIIEEKPDVVLDIVDASNIERNLYLTMLLLELEVNLVIALNKMDVAREKGLEIDAKRLSDALGVPVVPTIATKKVGMEDLKKVLLNAAKDGRKSKYPTYGKDVESLLKEIATKIKEDRGLSKRYSPRWLAIKLLEGDDDVLRVVKASPKSREILEALQ
ncbi:FeoB small GTPase domain-containing protein [Candidatus Pyrohabitans sp.]